MADINGMFQTPPLVLSLRSAGLKDVDPCNVNEMHNIWNAFSKAKNCIDGGDRFEYISWRIYSREVLRMKNMCEPLIVGPEVASTKALPIQDESQNSSEHSDQETSSESDWDDADSDYNDMSVSSSVSTFNGMITSAVTASRSLSPRKHSYHPIRRISSVELEHIFKENCETPSISTLSKPSPLLRWKPSSRIRSVAEATEHETFNDPINLNEKSFTNENSDNNLTIPKEQRREDIGKDNNGTSSITDDADSTQNSSKKNKGLHQEENFVTYKFNENHSPVLHTSPVLSPVVRGFNRSTVSISVNPHSMVDLTKADGGAQKTDRDTQHTNCKAADSGAKEASTEASKSMFFIASTESESECSSPDNDDEWDDISVNDDEDEESSNVPDNELASHEDLAETLFKERDVPETPELKRSLLSSLILNKLNDSEPAVNESTSSSLESPAPEISSVNNNKRTSPSNASCNSVSTIITSKTIVPNDAPSASVSSAPHVSFKTSEDSAVADADKPDAINMVPQFNLRSSPIAATSLTSTMLCSSLSKPVAISPEPAHTQDIISPHSPTTSSLSIVSPIEQQTHITARPEMHQAATISHTLFKSEHKSDSEDWSSLHEDIYDPLNYHARGW